MRNEMKDKSEKKKVIPLLKYGTWMISSFHTTKTSPIGWSVFQVKVRYVVSPGSEKRR